MTSLESDYRRRARVRHRARPGRRSIVAVRLRQARGALRGRAARAPCGHAAGGGVRRRGRGPGPGRADRSPCRGCAPPTTRRRARGRSQGLHQGLWRRSARIAVVVAGGDMPDLQPPSCARCSRCSRTRGSMPSPSTTATGRDPLPCVLRTWPAADAVHTPPARGTTPTPRRPRRPAHRGDRRAHVDGPGPRASHAARRGHPRGPRAVGSGHGARDAVAGR